MIVKRYVHKDDELAQHLYDHLNVPLEWPDDSLTAQHVANIAAAAACDVAYDQAAGGHLLDLIAALPLPDTDEGRGFWRDLWHAASTENAYLLPANVGPLIGFAENGESGLAGQVLSFISELTPDQRKAATEVIGRELQGFGLTPRQAGELWLRDAEITSWRVQLASHRRFETREQRQRFFEAWRSV